eukprot:SAG11_NODE_1100_length_5869_cov_8.279896_2_plen_116_part_00
MPGHRDAPPPLIGGRRRGSPAASRDLAVCPKSRDEDCWNGVRLDVREACCAALLMMAALNFSSRSDIAATNFGAQFSGMGVPIRPWIDKTVDGDPAILLSSTVLLVQDRLHLQVR